MEAVAALGRSGVLQRGVYFEVTRDEGKNLKDCVRRIDGDAVRGGAWERCGGGRAAGGGMSGSRGGGSWP